MGLTITYEHPDFDKDQEFSVAGLGTFKNGQATEVSDEAERSFVATNGLSVRDALAGNGAFTVAGTASVKASDMDSIMGVDVSDTPSPDPTAMNVGPDGKKFEHANLTGAVTDDWTGPTIEVDTLVEDTASTVANTGSTPEPAKPAES